MDELKLFASRTFCKLLMVAAGGLIVSFYLPPMERVFGQAAAPDNPALNFLRRMPLFTLRLTIPSR